MNTTLHIHLDWSSLTAGVSFIYYKSMAINWGEGERKNKVIEHMNESVWKEISYKAISDLSPIPLLSIA